MKTIACAAILALFVMSIATPSLTSARPGGPSANGNYNFVFEDDLTKQVEFEATGDGQGTATGRMTFRDPAGVVDHDPDGEGGRPEDPPSEFHMTADLDSLTIENNRALMGGTVRESSNQSYVGRWVQLVVEDNGDGKEVPDRLSWRFCQVEPSGWTPSDAEDPRDEGAWWRWWATDAEREDDRGVQSANIIPGNRRGCPTFPLSSYEFPEAKGEGQVQVLQ
ncbi:MAG: hypothetical protein AABN95_23385 [Acidobacteriota bacterium]